MLSLKPREYYEDLYDKLTVEHCRHMAAFDTTQGITEADFKNADLSAAEVKELGTKVVKSRWLDIVKEMSVFMYAGERYNKKNTQIDEWMRKDRAKDDFYAQTDPPRNAECRECLSKDLRVISKDLYWQNDKNDRVLYMFKCNDCGTNSAYFNNGEKWKIKATLCPICQSERNMYTKEEKNKVLTITYTCQRCDHVWQETLDFRPIKKEKPDPNYHEDRKLYCYSKKVRGYAESIQRMGPLLKNSPSREEIEKQAMLKKQIDELQKLTITQVTNVLTRVLKKHGYVDFRLGVIEEGRQLVVPFTLIDSKTDRNGDQSRSTFWKLTSKELEGTNWRLMRSSLIYRLGYIRGKLKGYEGDEITKLIQKTKNI